MKRSITKQIAIVFIGLLTGILVLCWILNSVFLETFYIKNKQATLEEAFSTMNRQSKKYDVGSDNFAIAMDKISSKSNIMMVIINAQANVMAATTNDADMLRSQLLDLVFNKNSGNTKTIKSTDSYQLQQVIDSRLDSEYLILWGTLSNGNIIMMKSPLASIEESVALSNRFYLYIGFVAILLSLIIITYVTRKITGPVLQLANISEKMTELDFDTKYISHGKFKNEIDVLGEHMNSLSENLETMISELKSANNELQLDNERKEKVDTMRKEFLSNISHELKSPLALIQGYAEGLVECVNDDDESRQFYCDVIMDEAGKMNDMVKKLLTLNQIEFGNESVVMERFDLSEVLKGVLNVSSLILKQKEIKVFTPELLPMFVWADEYQVEEVITNYLNNAMNHCEGDKEIRIRMEKEDNLVRLSIFNTGTPIPEEDLNHVWEKFYKVDKARTREYGGSGIGLSIVKAIMDSFNQKCGVKNYSDGVEFWFELDCSSKESSGS